MYLKTELAGFNLVFPLTETVITDLKQSFFKSEIQIEIQEICRFLSKYQESADFLAIRVEERLNKQYPFVLQIQHIQSFYSYTRIKKDMDKLEIIVKSLTQDKAHSLRACNIKELLVKPHKLETGRVCFFFILMYFDTVKFLIPVFTLIKKKLH